MKVLLVSIPGTTLISINSEIVGWHEGWISFHQLNYPSNTHMKQFFSIPREAQVLFDSLSDKDILIKKEAYLREKYGTIVPQHLTEADVGVAVEQWKVEIPDEELLTHSRDLVRDYAVKRLQQC